MAVQPPNQEPRGSGADLPPLEWRDNTAAEPDAGARPRIVTAAVLLILIGALNWVVGAVVVLATPHSDLATALADSARRSGQTVKQSELDTAVSFYVQVSVVTTIVALVIYLLMAALVARGRSWARLTSTVLAVLGVGAAFVLGLPAGFAGVRFFAVLVSAATVVLLWMRSSNTWFDQQRVLGGRFLSVRGR